MLKRFFYLTLGISLVISAASNAAFSQLSLRQKIGQMVMVTATGDSLEESSPSMDTLRSDLSRGLVGGVLMFTWSNNLKNPAQIAHLTSELQHQSTIPLLLAIDEEGGKVARLGPSNGFSGTPSAYQMGTVVNSESQHQECSADHGGVVCANGTQRQPGSCCRCECKSCKPGHRCSREKLFRESGQCRSPWRMVHR